jgi:dipeptidyl aminopeptidase/acylaminoacyl peptidase
MQQLLLAYLLSVSLVAAAVRSPDERPITDPKSIVSQPNSNAGPLPVEDLFYTRTVVGATWSPDGNDVVFTTNLTGRINLWRVPATGGWPLQLSPSDDRQMSPDWSPTGDTIVFQQDRAGAEYFDIFAVPPQGGPPINLTRTPDYSESGPIWSADGKRLLISRKRKGEPSSNVAVLDWQSRELRPLTAENDLDRRWLPQAWSGDGRYVFATRENFNRTDSDVYRLEVASGKAENLTAHPGSIYYTLSDVTAHGSTALITSNAKDGFSNLALLDVATKKQTWVTDLRWSVSAGTFSPDGRRFTYSVNEDGRTELYLADRATLKAEVLKFPTGVSTFSGRRTSFSPDGRKLLISHQSSQRPADVWVYDVAAKRATQLTFSAVGGLDPNKIPPSQLVSYRSFDGTIISAFLWVPFNLARDGRHPGVVLPHGGPTSQMTDIFNRTVAALASRGYVVIAPNPRGSTGYGMAFQQANYKDLGGGDLQDVVYGAKFLAATGYVDAKRIGITGGSYGGFMTMMALGKTPDVWAAGVQQFGIINWFTMYEHQDAGLKAYQRSLIGDPVADKGVWERCSPLTYMHQVKAPLLTLQGDNDIRVPKVEAVQVTKILQDAGKVTAAHYYANEGHGFQKRENQIDAIQRTLEWFEKYLRAAK